MSMWDGSMKLTVSPFKNQIFPSDDFVTRGPETSEDSNRPNSICSVECRYADLPLRVGGQGVQLGSRYTQESAPRVQPVGRQIVFDDPMHGVARQSVGGWSGLPRAR